MVNLTKRDLQVINSALALLEAEIGNDQEVEDLHEATAEDVASVREKVHERLAKYKDPYQPVRLRR